VSNLDLLAKESPLNSRNIIGWNHSIVIPLLANQDLTPMLCRLGHFGHTFLHEIKAIHTFHISEALFVVKFTLILSA